jgi:hypothetical protein|tara:strand:- start:397 stop:525 length:129 start_codon:yes stop_codon:yes gene_type:complete
LKTKRNEKIIEIREQLKLIPNNIPVHLGDLEEIYKNENRDDA